MKISYNWLKEYIKTDLPPAEVRDILTNIGLEVEGMETFQSVKGGLDGVVIGEVLTCNRHPNADKLTITTVDVGDGDPVQIICGASNVAAGQKVPVATIGTTLYPDEEGFTIKKAKIRGELSEGMICAEDELGLGTSHEGIMVLKPDAVVGTGASDYFNVETDTVFEIGLTPNRIDGASHLGVARDLGAYLNQQQETTWTRPPVDNFQPDGNDLPIEILIEEPAGCRRYSGLTITGITVRESPDWLQNRLKSIGLAPINNVVDITNYVLHEAGQPLHAFDAAHVTGNKVIIKTLAEGSTFVTLDEQERSLLARDLMICNEKEGMCIAGVFGGIKSGVGSETIDIFLESACFDPVYIRKTSKHHQLFTDASFRFERGSDPNLTVWALKRAAMLIRDIAGGKISEVTDVYPDPVEDFRVSVRFDHIERLIGKHIDPDTIQSILESLEIKVSHRDVHGMDLLVPPYRVDVQREADIVEEILRIYGFNNVEVSTSLLSTLSYSDKTGIESSINQVSDLLTANGFYEIKSNSLSRTSYYESESRTDEVAVRLFNPLSQDLALMRQNLLYGGLEAVAHNINRKNPDLKLYEFGACYFLDPENRDENPLAKYDEQVHLGIYLTGKSEPGNWYQQSGESSFYNLKTFVELVLVKLGFDGNRLEMETTGNETFLERTAYTYQGKRVVDFGSVPPSILKRFDIKQEVFAAEFNWDQVLKIVSQLKITFRPLPKFQGVVRDLSLLLDRKITFASLQKLAFKTEKKLLQEVTLFDVYEGDNIEAGKKSYALSFKLLDEDKTLTDKEIDKTMNNIAHSFEKELGAMIRGME